MLLWISGFPFLNELVPDNVLSPCISVHFLIHFILISRPHNPHCLILHLLNRSFSILTLAQTRVYQLPLAMQIFSGFSEIVFIPLSLKMDIAYSKLSHSATSVERYVFRLNNCPQAAPIFTMAYSLIMDDRRCCLIPDPGKIDTSA